jgi:hypothetical protein
MPEALRNREKKKEIYIKRREKRETARKWRERERG